jgi:hypothetical protein
MVDAKHIELLLRQHFIINGSYEIDAQGEVSITGSVAVRSTIKQLPVSFAHVSKNFRCERNHLVTLAGAPRSVGGDFWCQENLFTSLEHSPVTVGGSFVCHNNQLSTLQGAPRSVGGTFNCAHNPLQSIQHAPDADTLIFNYEPHMPLLQILKYKNTVMFEAPQDVRIILNKYVGTGKKGALACAAELIRAGYRENARW